MEALFWGCLVGAFYSYLIYPLILTALARRGAAVAPGPGVPPRVSIIIAARNESARIGAKLDNTLACAFPRERLEIIVISDASDDGTDTRVESYLDRGARLLRLPRRQGKEQAQALGIAAARGELLVFTDCATEMEPDGLTHLLAPFADPSVGAVSSEDRFLDRAGRVVGEGAYVRYEMALRQRESALAGLVGLSGSLFAARREVCAAWDVMVPSDFNAACNCARLGLKAVIAPRAYGWYRDLADGGEYRRKYRTVLRGMAGLARNRDLLNPFAHGLFAFQLFSHKLMRWLVPGFLLGLILLSPPMWGRDPLADAVIAGQFLLYPPALIGLWHAPLQRHAWVRIPSFFLQVNVAILHAWIAFLSGRRITVWEPSRR